MIYLHEFYHNFYENTSTLQHFNTSTLQLIGEGRIIWNKKVLKVFHPDLDSLVIPSESDLTGDKASVEKAKKENPVAYIQYILRSSFSKNNALFAIKNYFKSDSIRFVEGSSNDIKYKIASILQPIFPNFVKKLDKDSDLNLSKWIEKLIDDDNTKKNFGLQENNMEYINGGIIQYPLTNGMVMKGSRIKAKKDIKVIDNGVAGTTRTLLKKGEIAIVESVSPQGSENRFGYRDLNYGIYLSSDDGFSQYLPPQEVDYKDLELVTEEKYIPE